MIIRDTQSGYVALISVLIIGAVSLAVASALLITGADAQQENLARQQSAKARQAAAGCIDEALQQIHDAPAFTGTASITIAGTQCTYTVTNTGASTRTIDASSTSGIAIRKIQAYATIGASSLSISSWQEVP